MIFKTFIGIFLSAIFLLISGMHFYWGLGGKWRSAGTVPTKENNVKVVSPKLLDCFIVGFGLLAFAILILVESEILTFYLPRWLLRYGSWIIAVIFIVRAIGDFKYIGFFKKIKTTAFGMLDTKYYSPLCLVIGLLIIALKLQG